jgi:hypothetical protein
VHVGDQRFQELLAEFEILTASRKRRLSPGLHFHLYVTAFAFAFAHGVVMFITLIG